MGFHECTKNHAIANAVHSLAGNREGSTGHKSSAPLQISTCQPGGREGQGAQIIARDRSVEDKDGTAES
jgi:hypothetical protein